MADNLQSIEKLMGSYDSQRSRLAETQKLVEKWEPTGLLEGLEDTNKHHGMAVILENYSKKQKWPWSEPCNLNGMKNLKQ